jgi:hypothetical protein
VTLTEALALLLERGRIQPVSPVFPTSWALPGMAFVSPGGSYRRRTEGALSLLDVGDYELALNDPATVGCLLARLREAAREPTIAAVMHNNRWELQYWDLEIEDLDAWQPNFPYVETGDTEAQAIMAGLIAFAEAL